MTMPPSRFGAGFTVGAPTAGPAASTPPAGSPPPRVVPLGGAAPAPAQTDQLNGLALLSFVGVLLLGPLMVAVSIPMALIARAQIARRGQSGAGLVVATLALSVIYLAFGVVVLVLLFYAQSSRRAGAA